MILVPVVMSVALLIILIRNKYLKDRCDDHIANGSVVVGVGVAVLFQVLLIHRSMIVAL